LADLTGFWKFRSNATQISSGAGGRITVSGLTTSDDPFQLSQNETTRSRTIDQISVIVDVNGCASEWPIAAATRDFQGQVPGDFEMLF
jgi:hypothetical protein